MAFTTPRTWTDGTVVGASDLNTEIRDNMSYVYNGRPNSLIKRDANADYTTTNTSFVDIDGTNFLITLTINSGKALVFFTGEFVPGSSVAVDILVDGTRYLSGGADGFGKVATGNNVFAALCTGLSGGSHTFKPQWKAGTGATQTLRAGGGGALADSLPTLFVLEVG